MGRLQGNNGKVFMDNTKFALLCVAVSAGTLALCAAYDRAKAVFNKRFPDFEPLVEYDPKLGVVGLGILCTYLGFSLGCDAPLGKNLSTLGLVSGNALIFHYELINSFEVARTLIFDRNKKPQGPTEIKTPREKSAPGMKWYSAYNVVSKWGDKIPALMDLAFK